MPIPDRFESHADDLSGPVIGGLNIVPDDIADLPVLTRGLMVATAGDVAVTFKDGSQVVLPELAPGVIYPVRLRRVAATGTTATGLRGLY